MKVVCINDLGRPAEIPVSKWLTKGLEYTVTKKTICRSQNNAICFTLAEIDLTGCQPYWGFNANRFGLLVSQEEFDKMVEQGIIEVEEVHA